MQNSDALYQHLLDDLAPYSSPAVQALRSSFLKKDESKCSATTRKAALDLFVQMNDRCKHQGRMWSRQYVDLDVRNVLHEAQAAIARWFPASHDVMDYCERHGAFGPGVTQGTNGTSYLHKTAEGQLTATNRVVLSHYGRAQRVNFTSYFAFNKHMQNGSVVGCCSKFSTVPKTPEIDRCIAIEPSCNMFLQRGLGKYIDRQLKNSIGYDPRIQQDRNRLLAHRGSIDGSISTIDLKSASDTLSIYLCAYLLPRHLMFIATNLRSNYILIDGKKVPLYMMSTMGNGFTFSLETLIYSALTYGCYVVNQIPFRMHGKSMNVGIFGDDIACDTRVFDLLCRTLEGVGAIVNRQKSYNSGPFRESCGRDFHDGKDVRGVYLRRLVTTSDYCSIFNRLFVWSLKHKIPLIRSLNFIYDHVKSKAPFVPMSSPDDSGIRVNLEFLRSHGKLCYDENLSIKYRALCAVPRMKLATKLSANQHALLQAFLQGTVRDSKISLRTTLAVRHRSKSFITPNWDYVGEAIHESVFRGLSHYDLEQYGLWLRLTLRCS